MPEVICNTSPLQYLHQLGLLHVLPALAGSVIVPSAAVEELAVGRARGVDVPVAESLEWVTIRRPVSVLALPLASDLGPGEAQVLALGLESTDAVVVLDDGRARRVAAALGLRLTGTLGLLLDAKKAGLVPAIRPLLDELDALRFRVDRATRTTMLKLAREDV